MNKFKVFGLAMALFWLTMVACTPAQEGNTNEESNLTKGEASVADTEVLPFFIGTYTNDTIKGIYYSILDLSSGQMKAPALAAESKNPSFLTLSSDQKHLYAVNELSPEESQVTSFSVDKKEGKLTEINSISAQGGAPCYVSISRDGSRGYVANYVGGNVISFGINTDGHLEGPAQSIKHEGSSITERQGNPHAHSIIPHPTLPYIYAADLGTDQVFIYKADGEGALTKNE
ncbi:MAG: lactonase family protein, partial [Cyclobacteriaceae bacterium]|nr:lactonase family protein [Cyclobacteriaceae bacterium]